MARLEQITVGASIKGVLPDSLISVVAVEWFGDRAINLTYRDATGQLGSELLYRDREPSLEVAVAGRPWSFDGDGGLFRLVAEAHRIQLAYLFDPLLAVHTSLVEPLPHQITAVCRRRLVASRMPFASTARSTSSTSTAVISAIGRFPSFGRRYRSICPLLAITCPGVHS